MAYDPPRGATAGPFGTRNDTHVFTDAEGMAIRAVLGKLRFGAMAGTTFVINDVRDLVRWLDGFAQILGREVDVLNIVKAERDDLVDQRDTVRDFLGINDLYARIDNLEEK